MKLFKRLFLLSVVAAMVAFAFRNEIYSCLFAYKVEGERANYRVETDTQLANFIDQNIKKSEYSAKELISLSLNITSMSLSFEASPTSNDPNTSFKSHQAHCVGYAAYQSAVCNYLFQRFGLDKEWAAQPLYGKIYFMGVDLHPFFKGPFFRNHDFVRVENHVSKEVYYTDPSFNDYLHIDYVRVNHTP